MLAVLFDCFAICINDGLVDVVLFEFFEYLCVCSNDIHANLEAFVEEFVGKVEIFLVFSVDHSVG